MKGNNKAKDKGEGDIKRINEAEQGQSILVLGRDNNK